MKIRNLKKTKTWLLLVVLLSVACQRARADFAFGQPKNLGPEINGRFLDGTPCISTDGTELYFTSTRTGGHGDYDLWLTARSSTNEQWSIPVNLGSSINSPVKECFPCLTADGLTMYFSDYYYSPVRANGLGSSDLWMCVRVSHVEPWSEPFNAGASINTSSADVTPTMSGDGLVLVFVSNRPGGPGRADILMTTRPTTQDQWEEATLLGGNINTASFDGEPALSADGLALFFTSDRGGGFGGWDLWMATRKDRDDPWSQAVNLGPAINTSADESTPFVSPDMTMLYFGSTRPGGFGDLDIWVAPIQHGTTDFNGDGIVNSIDMCLMVDQWGTDDPVYDIGPTPWGDGVVDAKDLRILAENLFEEVIDPTLVVHWALDETEGMVVADSLGKNDGYALGGPVWVPDGGQVNGGLELDGVDDFISTPAVLDPADGPFSVLAWIKGGGPGQVIISESGGPDWLSVDLLTDSLMTDMKASGRGAGPLLSQAFITDGNWHRIGLVWDGSYRTLYVDGLAVAEDMQRDLESSASGLYVGCGVPTQPETFFSGLIDDVRIYSRVVMP